MFALATVLMIVSSSTSIADEARSFDVDAGQAVKTLKLFAKQSELGIVFDSRSVKDVRTEIVVGLMIPSDALKRMLENTTLVFDQDDETGAFAVTRVATEEGMASSSVSQASQGQYADSVMTTRNEKTETQKPTPMNENKKTIGSLFKGLLGLAIATAPNLSAQDDASKEDEIFELSPFEIDASKDQGYRAENTLAGSRLNSSLRDTPAAIQVYTREFIEDLGATNLEDILNYSANVEPGEGDEESFFGGHFAVRGQVSYQPRVRGLASTRARDYFRSEMPFDTYLIERLDESRGPNSLLFGIAAAGGIQNQYTKRASVADNFGRVTFRTDEEGLIRGEFDYNQVLIEDKLAFRLNALHSDEDGWRLNTFNRKNAVHGGLTWRPDDKTHIRLGYESFSQDDIPSNIFVGLDDLRGWIDAGQPTFDLFSENRIPEASESGAVSGGFRNTVIRAVGGHPNHRRIRVAIIEGGDPSFEGRVINVSNALQTVPWQDTDGDGSYTSHYRIARDETDYPLDVALFGPANKRQLEATDFTASLQRQLAEDFFVQLDYSKWSYYWAALPSNIWVQMKGDPNEFYGGHDGPATAIANPNVGGTFSWSPGGTHDRFDTDADQETMRLTATYEFDFAERGDGGLSNLGRHRIAAGLEKRDYNWFRPHRRLQWRDDATGGPVYDTSQPGGVLNRVASMHYIDLNDRSTWHGTTLERVTGGALDGVSERFPDPTDPSRTIYAEWALDSAVQHDSSQVIDTWMVSTQSFFFDDKLVITAGLREDDGFNKYFLYEANANNSDYMRTGEFRPTDWKVDSFTAGAVFHINDQFSVFYNQATNSDIPLPENNIIGSLEKPGQLGFPGEGEGEDYGVMANLYNGKINLRATRYTSRGRNVFKSDGLLSNLHDTTIEWWDDIGFGLPDDPPGPRRFANPVGRVTYTGESQGYEFQMTANLTDNWRSVFNYSYTDKEQKDVAPLGNLWYDQTIEWVTRTIQTWDTSTITQQQIDAGIIPTNDLDEFVLEDGRTATEQFERVTIDRNNRFVPGAPFGVRPAKWNFFTNYTFTEGPLQGFSVGGGYRYQGPNALHWEFDSSGNRTRIWGESTGYVDLMLRYRTKMMNIWGKDVRASYQINVQNLFDDNDPVIGRYWRNDRSADPDRAYFVDPRNIQFSATFDF
ncbi:MAG: TonB-dependent receptor plug domain-containing protein [Opitutaceae bacterium]|nr:TonB-dependent receptor plug domain-containing protein [Opitutaceae bacterium]